MHNVVNCIACNPPPSPMTAASLSGQQEEVEGGEEAAAPSVVWLHCPNSSRSGCTAVATENLFFCDSAATALLLFVSPTNNHCPAGDDEEEDASVRRSWNIAPSTI